MALYLRKQKCASRFWRTSLSSIRHKWFGLIRVEIVEKEGGREPLLFVILSFRHFVISSFFIERSAKLSNLIPKELSHYVAALQRRGGHRKDSELSSFRFQVPTVN